jgi:hypothetical protein
VDVSWDRPVMISYVEDVEMYKKKTKLENHELYIVWATRNLALPSAKAEAFDKGADFVENIQYK